MKRRISLTTKMIARASLAALGASVVSAAPQFAPRAHAQNGPAGVAAEVNSDKIPLADVNRQVNMLRDSEPSLRADTPEAKKTLQQFRDTVVDGLIEWRLMVQESKRQKVKPEATQIDRTLADFKKQYKTDAEFQTALKKEGKKPQDLRTLITEGLQISELRQRWLGDVVVSEAEIAKYYRDNIKAFAVPEGVRVRHILIGVPKGAAPDVRTKARDRAADLLKQARAKNADFGVLAQQNSDDPGTKNQGGDLGGFITRQDPLVKPFLDAAFATKTGEVVGPVETDFGYHVIRVDEKKAARTLTLNEAREPFVRPALLTTKREQILTSKINGLKAKAKIKKYL